MSLFFMVSPLLVNVKVFIFDYAAAKKEDP